MAIRLQRADIARLIGLLGLAALFWLAASVSVANGVRRASPELALRLQPNDALARTIKADFALSLDADAETIARIRRDASRAIARDPTNARSFRVLAIADSLQGNEKGAGEKFAIADALSRRDLPTQLWLIERNVARNDVTGALTRFAIALTTAPQSKEVLFPVLVNAAGDRSLADPIARFLSVDHPWRHELLFRIASDSADLEGLANFFTRFRAAGQRPQDDVVQALIDRFVTAGDLTEAVRQYRLATGVGAAALRDGDFRAAPRFPPVDWALAESGNANAAIVSDGVEPGSGALEFSSSSGAEVEIARQILTLAPGRYSLAAMGQLTDASEGANAQWKVQCAGGGRVLAALPPLAVADAPRRSAAVFTVPASGCAGQWLSLAVDAGGERGSVAGLVERIGINRAP